MREIVLDTETTGLNPKLDRVVEIGCLELMNHVPTGRTFHVYINPEMDMPPDAERVHGLTTGFLADKPLFAAVAEELVGFIDGAPVVAHNAGFDIGFLNAELGRLGRELLAADRSIDTVELARRKFPGAQASLDALCRRFEIDNSHRTKHGALLDAELLACVYLELIGGREPGLSFGPAAAPIVVTGATAAPIVIRPPRVHAPTAAELERHTGFLATVKDPIWLRRPT